MNKNNNSNYRIIGIDPGLGITGYSIIELNNFTPSLIEAGCIKPNKKDSLEKRLKDIYKNIILLIKNHKPDIMVVEDLYSHYAHPKTSIIMGHVRGVIFLSASMNNLLVRSFSANKIKLALTGNGHSNKKQIQLMVQQKFNLKSLPEPPDVADAIAVALCYVNTFRYESR